MNKMNKKGFTLIEMLVVIAIIAVLVSIIIPVVGNSTDKAAAATNAANLRSYKATLTTAYLSGDLTVDAAGTTATAQNGTSLPTPPTSKKCGKVEEGVTATFKFENNEFKVTFGTNDIDAFAAVAGGASSSTLAEAKKSTVTPPAGGSGEQGSNDQGSNDQGSNDQGSNDQGSGN